MIAGLAGWAIGIATVLFVRAVAFRVRPETTKTPEAERLTKLERQD